MPSTLLVVLLNLLSSSLKVDTGLDDITCFAKRDDTNELDGFVGTIDGISGMSLTLSMFIRRL